MHYTIRKPEAYLIASTSVDTSIWSYEFIRSIFQILGETTSVEAIDELEKTEINNIASLVLKFESPMSDSTFQFLAENIQLNCPPEVSARLIRGAALEGMVFKPKDISTEYFKKERVHESYMINPIECCVKLTHRPTGIIARCTSARSKFINYDEALLLLKSLLNERLNIEK
jgi:hypothetical protein